MTKGITAKNDVTATGCHEDMCMQFRKNNVMANLWKNDILESNLLLESNSPATVTPLMEVVRVGCALGGSELALTHNVCEPESQRRRCRRFGSAFSMDSESANA